MDAVRSSARRILDEFRQYRRLSPDSLRNAGWESLPGDTTPATVLLFAARAVLQVRQETGADPREVVSAAIGDEAERVGMESLAQALVGDMAAARAARQHGVRALESVVALLAALIELEGVREEEIDELLAHAASFAEEAASEERGTRVSRRGSEAGPWDESEAGARAGELIDLGGLRIPRETGISVELNEGGTPPRPLAVTVRKGSTALQIQAYYSSGEPQWAAARDRIARDVLSRGGEAKEWSGRIGPELRCVVPVETDSVSTRHMPVLMLGCDGPGWLLRCMVTGSDAESGAQETWAYSYVERVVVVPSYVPRERPSLSPTGFGFSPVRPVEGPIPLRMPG
ncbi:MULTISPECIES: DUF3710 domain-containing protein [unclassified Streptomyces]|uniref:DUF3710 domain-containing protein n=1 Tax=unclassified Streptomyces TaxID=2593676 RepID=UPI0036F594A9